MKLSIAVIFGNESIHLERFIKSFSWAADEFVFVQAIGNQEQDSSIDIIFQTCPVPYEVRRYYNEGVAGPLNPDAPGTWPHVDDFSKARQMAFDLCKGQWVMWADCDDLFPENAENKEAIRRLKAGLFDMFTDVHGTYHAYGSVLNRERIVKNRMGRWQMPIHEAYVIQPQNLKPVLVPELSIVHDPLKEKTGDALRNLRIIQYAIRHPEKYPNDQAMLHFYLHRDLFNLSDIQASLDAANQAIKFKELPEVERYEVLLNAASICIQLKKPYVEAKTRLLNAINICPWRREAYVLLAQISLWDGQYRHMLGYTSAYRGIRKPQNMERPWTLKDHHYGWFGAMLHHQALRLNGRPKEALALEREVFELEQGKITIIQPTRLNSSRAINCRNDWLSKCSNAGAIQWIFAIDEDDAMTRQNLQSFHCVVSPGAGNSKAVLAALEEADGEFVGIVPETAEAVPGWDLNVMEALKEKTDIHQSGVLFGTKSIVRSVVRGHSELCGAMDILQHEECGLTITKPTFRLEGGLYSVYKTPRFVICGKQGISHVPDYQSPHAHYELGWEINTTHVMAKRLLLEGKLSTEDTIVTLPGREFLYASVFPNVITWDCFCFNKGLKVGTPIPNAGDEETLDLCWDFERRWFRFPGWYTSGPHFNYDRPTDWPKIQNVKVPEVNPEEPFLCVAIRNRPHESIRNVSEGFAAEVLRGLRRTFHLPIKLVGLNLPDYGVEDVHPVPLDEWVSLLRHPHCVAVLGPHTGTMGVAGLLAPKDRNLILFPMQDCISIDGNFPTGMGKCLNLNKNKRHWLKTGSTPYEIVEASKKILCP